MSLLRRLPPAVFLDRDGTMIVEKHYLADPDGVEILPGVALALKRLEALGVRRFVVTNQSAVGRGWLSPERLDAIHRRMLDLLAAEGASIDGIFVCPHTPTDACGCRKPLPGLIEAAARAFGLDATHCPMIGDKPCDIELARWVGTAAILVRTGYGANYPADAVQPDAVVSGVKEAVDWILAENSE